MDDQKTIVPPSWTLREFDEAVEQIKAMQRSHPANKGFELLMRLATDELQAMAHHDAKADLLSDPKAVEKTLRRQGQRTQLMKFMCSPLFGYAAEISTTRERLKNSRQHGGEQ